MLEEKNVNSADKLPQMRSIREIAKMGVMREGTLRKLVRENKISHIRIGRGRGGTVYVNCDKLYEMLTKGAEL